MMKTENAHQSLQKDPQLLQKMAKSVEKDNRSKRIMEEQNMEVRAKRGKLDHEPDNGTYNAHEEGDGDMGSDLDILDIMMKRITESREKYPLPKYFKNCTGGRCGNRMLRFDDIGPISHPSDFYVLIPPGIREFVQHLAVYSSGSKDYAFVSFDYYQLALNFLKKFNNLKVPGTEVTFNISWAPLKYDEESYDPKDYDHIFQTLGDKQIDESKGNQFDVPTENIEKDKQVDVVKALEMKTVESGYDGEHLLEGKKADQSKDVLAENIEKDEQVDDPNALDVKLVECDEHEHDDEHSSCTTEEEHVDESKGNQFDGPGENFENDKQGDVLKVENIAAGVEKLFSRLDEEAHSGKDGDGHFIDPDKFHHGNGELMKHQKLTQSGRTMALQKFYILIWWILLSGKKRWRGCLEVMGSVGSISPPEKDVEPSHLICGHLPNLHTKLYHLF